MGKDIQVIVFELGKEKYGAEISSIGSIERVLNITRLPNSPSFVSGIMHVHGEIIPIVDIRKIFDINTEPLTDKARILIYSVDGTRIGFIADSAENVITVNEDDIDKSLDINYMDGIIKQKDYALIILLNLKSVLSKQQLDKVNELKV